MVRRVSLLAAMAAVAAVAVAAPAQAQPHEQVAHLAGALQGARTFQLPRAATHVAVYWRGPANAAITVRYSRDGRHFGRVRRVQVDEIGTGARPGVTFGTLMLAHGATALRVRSDRALRVRLLALTDRRRGPRSRAPVRTATATAQPPVISRAGWNADESLRFDSTGKEVWPPAFYPVQKLIVHHTDTQNNDPDPAATVRSIYYYHAVTQGWGDIGYNFLIDESGRIYEGRHSRTYAPGESPTGQDLNGSGVTAAHAQGFNSGTVGVSLLGTLTNQDATPAARQALTNLLAWEASSHGIDPHGSSLYTNPVSGTQATFPNIAGHRDVNATECPGGVFYATLPALRNEVAAMISGSPPPLEPAPLVSTGGATSITRTNATVSGSVNPQGAATTYSFQYGRTTSYGSVAPSPAVSAGSGTSATAVSVRLGSLSRRTTYHYRLVATSAGGTSYGADRSFTTAR